VKLLECVNPSERGRYNRGESPTNAPTKTH